MTQNFPLVTIDPTIKTGVQLATDLENFSETMRSMMSGPARPADLIEGLWLRANPDATAEIVYSNASNNVDIALFSVATGGGSVQIAPAVGLGSGAPATDSASGVVTLATPAEALAGTSTNKVPLVRETQSMIQQAIDNLVNGSGSALDTLNEISAALGDDPNFATTMTNALAKRVRVDAAQTLSATEQQQGRDNLALGSLAVQNAIDATDIDAGAITTPKIAAAQITKDKLATNVFASSADALAATPPADQALSPQAFFGVDEVAVVDVPANAPTTLAGNGYKRRFYIQSTGGMYRYVPAPVDAFILQGVAPAALTDLADVDTSGVANGYLLRRNGTSWVAQAYERPLGYGQTWQDVSAIRSAGTVYQNTTGQPIMVHIINQYGVEIEISADNVTYVLYAGSASSFGPSASSAIAPLAAPIVPPGHYYKSGISGQSIWVELR